MVLFPKHSCTRELRGISLTCIFDGSQDSNSQEHYCPDPDPAGRYVHHVCAPYEPTEHDHEASGIKPKRHRSSPLNAFVAASPCLDQHDELSSNRPLLSSGSNQGIRVVRCKTDCSKIAL